MTEIDQNAPVVEQANGHTVPHQRDPVDDPPNPPAAPVLEDAVSPTTGEQDQDERSAPVAVDQPHRDQAPLPWTVPGQRRPLVPAWVLDAAQRRAALVWAAKWTGHGAAFHALRVPKYAVRACWYTPRGAARAAARWFRWVFDWDAHSLRLDLIQKREASAYHTAARHRDDRVKNRALGSVAAVGAVLLGAFIASRFYAPTPDLLLAAAGGALVWNGRPVDKPFLIDRTILPTQIARLTSDVVARALGSLGIGELRRAVDKRELAFTAPIVRDGPGWRAEIDLPHGIAAVDIMEKRRELSSGLRRPLGCVWPAPVEENHSGHLVLWVGDRSLSQTPAVPYPLLERGSASVFDPLPFGTDQRGRPQSVCLMFASAAVGAQPRMGKTFAVRLLALGAALDPTCELHIYDGKGMGDYVMFEIVAHTFLSGSRTDTLVTLLADLEAVKAEVERRADLLTELTRAGKCREGKVTPELARDRSLRLHPIVYILDECHLAFETGSGEAGKLGKEITALAEYLVRVGPAAGVTLVASTQRPDAVSLPSGIRANVQLRFCLRVADQGTNDMVLGTSAYKNGVRATEFAKNDKGIGYLAGEGTEPVIVRTHLVDADQSARILARARAARENAGTITGMAAGIAPTRKPDPAELLADVLAAVGSEEQIWSEAICARLAEASPGRYAGWDATTLAKALKPFGVITAQVWWTPPTGKATNRNGVRREQITDALEAIRNTSA